MAWNSHMLHAEVHTPITRGMVVLKVHKLLVSLVDRQRGINGRREEEATPWESRNPVSAEFPLREREDKDSANLANCMTKNPPHVSPGAALRPRRMRSRHTVYIFLTYNAKINKLRGEFSR